MNDATYLEVWNSLMQLVGQLKTIMSATEDQFDELATGFIDRRVVESYDSAKINMKDLKQAMSRELEGSVLANMIGFWVNILSRNV